MKNVLFTTTALVAMTGTAFAAAHASGPAVTFSGNMTAGYNDVIEGGLFWEFDLDLGVSVDLGDNVTATLSTEVLAGEGTTDATSINPTIEIAYTGGSMTASLKFGDLGDMGASEYYYADRSGMNLDMENHDGTEDVRAMVEFGSFGVAVGCSGVSDGECDGMNVGAGATFGSIKLGLGYDEYDFASGQGELLGVSADATFGALSVGVSYATGDMFNEFAFDADDADATSVDEGRSTDVHSADSTGIELGYAISEAINVGAYYAMNSRGGDGFGASVSYTAGSFSVAAFYDVSTDFPYTAAPGGVDADGDGSFTNVGSNHSSTETTEFGADLSMAMSDQITASAGILVAETTSGDADLASAQATSWYVGMEYAVNDNISATVSYSEGDEVGGPEFKDGISAFITATF